jgi:GntR family transcriptional regulator/MocR family aminotransferase
MHLVLWLKESLDDREVVAMAARAGVAVRAMSPMFSPGNGRPGLVLGFGGFSNEQMKEAAERLAAVITDAVKSGARRRDAGKPASTRKGRTGQ